MLEKILIIAAVLLDRLTKYLVCANIYNSSAQFIPGFIGFRYCENTGAAFGMLAGKSWLFYVVTPLSLLLMGYILYRASRKKEDWPVRLSCLLIIAGALGNLIDRLARGFVVDMFYFKLINFPVFNVADIYVTCSAVFLAILLIFRDKEEDLNQLLKSLKG